MWQRPNSLTDARWTELRDAAEAAFEAHDATDGEHLETLVNMTFNAFIVIAESSPHSSELVRKSMKRMADRLNLLADQPTFDEMRAVALGVAERGGVRH